MSDIWHNWGGDLSWSATGDLLSVDGTEKGKQRVLRRLLTAPMDYIWDPEYGAGFPAQIGQVTQKDELEAIARSQMFLEDAVAQDPLPVVTSEGRNGTVVIRIQYQDTDTNEPAVVGFEQRD